MTCVYLNAGEVGIAIGQGEEEVGLNVHHSQDNVLPPVVLEHSQKPSNRHHKHSIESEITQ